mgnify:CR=1 FL=1
MYVELIYSRNDWNAVLNACRTTIGKNATDREPSSRWKKNLLLAEHSPIRKLQITVKVHGVKSWIATHFARHHIGIEKYISTQRNDRTGIDRDKLPQDSLVDLEMDLNAQAMINISRKRLCNQAHKETKEVWQAILDKIKEEMPELYSVCVEECVYRGFCPEMKCCGYCETEKYKEKLEKYRKH